VTKYDPEGRADTPALSPDGTRVAYSREGDIALMALPSGDVKNLTVNPFSERYPRFSPDGKRIYFQSHEVDPSYPRRGLSAVASVEVP
jgi:Tol biopolymer transport system component